MSKHYAEEGILQKLEIFFDISPDLFCIAGYDGYFKRINPAVSSLLGYSEAELFSRPINDFVYPEDKDITAEARTKLTKSHPLLNFENRYLTKNGETVWLSWTSMYLENEELIFAIAKDISLKKNLELERNLLLHNLTDINQKLKNLSYTVTHDLRAPVNNLISIFQLLDSSKIQDPRTLKLIEVLKSSSDNLKETLNNYVDILYDEDKKSQEIEKINFKDSLDSVLKSIPSLIKNSQASLQFDFEELKEIEFNSAYMGSIFLNLITNSIKYAKPEVTPVISITSSIQHGKKKLIFEDNGLGFDMDKVKDKIFGINQKFHNHSDSKGIGLYLIYNHIKSLGGDISVESEVNVGTKFTITFND
ncbi:PAS domain S-box protein [Aquiflexum sp.]|uniref:PAS domain-containing sensor histidine kinase n=1 Tax=Aquiflexum sp. TaxID=1872584 RepID=UPI00359337C6